MKTDFLTKIFISPFQRVFQRFSIPIFIAVMIAMICNFLIIKGIHLSDEKHIFSLIISLGIGFFLTISVKLLQEKYHKNLYFLYGLVFLYAILIYFFNIRDYFFSSGYQIIFLLIHFFAFLTFIFWVSYHWNEKNNLKYTHFFQIALQSLLQGLAVTIITIILGCLALFAIQFLFQIENHHFEKTYWVYIVSVCFIFAPTYILSNFPQYENLPEWNIQTSKQIIFVNTYITVPFVIFYFIILYAYSLKVLANFGDWPKGIISYLVIIFSLISLFVYMTTANMENSKYIKIFRKYLPFAVFFQTFMLFYAIGLRINQYGLTPNRYVVVIIGAILFILSLYFIISKIKRTAVIPAIFSLFSLFILFWPWGIFHLPYSLQLQNFLQKAQEYQVFDGEKFIKNENLSSKQEKILYESIDFLCSYKNNCYHLEKFLPENLRGNNISAYRKQNAIFEQVGIEYGNAWYSFSNQHLNLYSKNTDNHMHATSGFEYFVNFDVSEKNSDIIFSHRNNIFVVKKDEKILFEKNITEDITRIFSEYEAKLQEWYNYFPLNNPIIFEFENDDFKTKIIINNIMLVKNSEGKIAIENNSALSGIMLVDDKNNIFE